MPIIGGTTLTQSSFRFRNDDGSETTATWAAAQDTNFNPAVSTLFRIRFEIKASSFFAHGLNAAFKLKYSLNGGAYTDVAAQGATTDIIRYANSPNITDNEVTTEQMAGSGTFLAGACDENGNTGTIAFPASRDTEIEFVLEIYSGVAAGGDTIDLRVYRTGGQALNTYTLTPRMTVAATDFTLVADSGSYSLTGTAASLEAGREVAAGAGSYAITGTAVNLLEAHKISANSGSYSLNGTAVNLLEAHKITADSGSYAITGGDAILEFDRTIAADSGSYALTGTDVNLLNDHTISADSGSYALTGGPVDLNTLFNIGVDSGSYGVLGFDVGFNLQVPVISRRRGGKSNIVYREQLDDYERKSSKDILFAELNKKRLLDEEAVLLLIT